MTRVVVDRPIQARGAHGWSIPVSRRFENPDGSFGGVIFAGLNASQFTDFYAHIFTGSAGAMMLVGQDGIVRARYVPTEGPTFGQDMRESTLATRLRQSPIGSYLSSRADALETTQRYFSYRVVPGRDLVVLVGNARSDVLSDIEARKGTNYLVASLATLFAAAAAAAVMMLLNRQRGMIDELADSETRLRATFDQAAVGICEVSLDQKVLRVNRRFAEMLGYTEQELQALDVTQIIDPERQADLELLQSSLAQHGRAFSPLLETRCVRKDGQLVWVLATVARVGGEVPGHDYFIAVIQDITQQKATQHELMFKNTVLATQQDASPDAVLLVDEHGQVVSCNRPCVELWGVPDGLLDQKDHEPLLQCMTRHVQDPEQFVARMRYLQEHKEEKSHEFIELVDGRTVERYSAPVLTPQGAYLGRVWYFRDVSERRQYEEKLRHLANHDSLTGLPNRVLFKARTAEAMASAQRHGDRFAILFIDLDLFKNVNDSLGHAAGDLLLQQIAERTLEAVRDTDTVSRFGGDEFAVLLQRLRDEKAAESIAMKVLSVLARPFHVADHELFVTASIGIACYPSDGKTVEELLRNADAAMYSAKAGGRNSTRAFASELNERAYEVLTLTSALRQAIERGELALHYQPRYELSSGRLSGVEALARWTHPTMGAIPPGKFIPIAEDAGLIGEIGLWVLRTACRQMKAWQAAGIDIGRIAVNLSARQFHDPRLIDHVTSALNECELDAGLLELEVTESVMMKDPDAAARTLQQLHAMRVSISIDDFGTGYSSLGYLKRFPISHVKIDRSFVSGLPDALDDVGIVRAIVALAKTLKLEVIGEGVETAEQRGFLRECGCDEAQGYLFCKPLPPLELEQAIKDEIHGRPGLTLVPRETAA